MEHILDLTGLTYLWGKIKNLFATKAELAEHPTGRIYYGTCSTTANTYVKEATVETFPLDEDDKPLVGTVVAIKYSVSNTYKTEGQTYALNVNNTGAYPMYYNNAAVATSTSANTLVAGYKNRHVFYVFNGTQWVWLSASYDTNTTYSGMTQAEVDAGTGTTARLITPARLRDNFYTEDEVDTLLGSKANSNDLATVATSGSYNDLEDTPTIPAAVTESTVSGWGFTKNTGTYSKPSSGIPSTDLTGAVQSTLAQVGTNATDIATLQSAYQGLTQSDIIVVADHTALVSPSANTIYREQGTTSYSDWMYYNSTWYKMAEYNNAIDDVPTANSNNLVKSGGVYSAIKNVDNKLEIAPITYKFTQNGYSDIIGTDSKYIKTNGSTASYSTYFISTSFEVKAGQCIRLTNFECTSACSIAKVNNGSYTPIYTKNVGPSSDTLYTFTEDCTIVVSGEKRDFSFTITTYDPQSVISTTAYSVNTTEYIEINANLEDKIIVKMENIANRMSQSQLWLGFTNSQSVPSSYYTFKFSDSATEIELDITSDGNYKYLYFLGHFSGTRTIYDGNGINILSNLENRVTVLEEGNASEIGVVSPAISSIASKTGEQVPKVLHNYLCLIHQSDIHGDTTRMQRMINFANKYKDRIDGILSTGDFAASSWSDQGFENTYVATLPSCQVPHFPVIGNHDIGLAKTLQNNSITAAGARFITPYMTTLGAVQGGTDAGYYYKDFSSYNVRLIVLCEYEMPRVPNSGNSELKYSIWGRYFTQAQANWLVQTLNSVQSDWYVIIAMHQIIDVFQKYDNEFKGTVNFSNADVSMHQPNMLQDIVDAYISKGTLSKTYYVSNTDSSEVPEVSVSADFTSANGEFICYINGHTHNDGTGQSSVATNKQVNISVTTGSVNTNTQAIYDDLYRVIGERSEDAFNVLCFDTDRKEIRMLRIGANVNNQMKRRDYACIQFNQN